MPKALRLAICQFPLLAITEGFWERAGKLRSGILRKGRRARLGDALIAQLAIDHQIPLVTRDSDFKYFQQVSKLELA
jgi:predicted nucleic acid-binding protein